MEITKNQNMLYLSDGMGISHLVRRADQVKYPEHYHNFVELVYMFKGHCIHVIDGREYPSRAGDMLVVNYGQSHEIIGDTPVEYVNIYMKPEYINQALADRENAFALLNLTEFEDFRKIIRCDRCQVQFRNEERQKIEQLILLMEEDAEREKEGRDLAMRCELNLILIMIFRKLSITLYEKFDGINESLLSYIDKYCHEKLTLEQISDMCSYNKSYFSRLFKKYTGMNFTAYLSRVRIQKASRLLAEGGLNIEEIAVRVGYTDKTKFFKDFKAEYGKTPLQYRFDTKSKN